MAQESIYKYIKQMARQKPQLPYVFQKPQAGWRDVSHVLWGEALPLAVKEKIAAELVERIALCLRRPGSGKRLRYFLRKRPIYLYLLELSQRLKLYLAEGLLSEKELYALGMKLATQSPLEEEVKLGLLILGFFENNLVRQIIKTLGLHGEFTLYAVEASRNFAKQNEFLFQLLQATRDFGKLVALALFTPLKPEEQEWLFKHGAVNKLVPEPAVYICFTKTDMIPFYQDLILEKTNYVQLSYLWAYLAKENDIKKFGHSFALAEKYLLLFTLYGKTFLDFAAVVMLEQSLLLDGETDWSIRKKNRLLKLCREIIQQPKWKNIVLNELARPREKTDLLLAVFNRLKMTPTFWEFIPLLQRDLFSLELLEFFLIENPRIYVKEIQFYLQYVLPESVLNEAPLAKIPTKQKERYKPDLWLVFLIRSLRKAKIKDEALFMRCLTARFPDVRREAILALRVFESEWSAQVSLALQQAEQQEPLKSIKHRLESLLGRKNKAAKQQSYLDLAGMHLEPSPFDVCLLKTKVAGTGYRDLLVVEGQLESGDLLYLVPQAENKDDLIRVTTVTGYVLGFIPRQANRQVSTLLQQGERLYAFLLNDDWGQGKLEIQIMFSQQLSLGDKVIPFPFSTKQIKSN